MAMETEGAGLKRAFDDEQNGTMDGKRVRPDEVAGLREADVGITYFLSPQLAGFAGQIKQRYTDFLVNEIDKDGNVVHLTDKGFNMPKKAKQEGNTQREAELAVQERQTFQLEPQVRMELVEVFGEADLVKIEDVYRNAQKMETEKSFDEKSERTKIHQLLRKAFNNELESVTTEKNTFKIARNNRKSRVNKQVWAEQTKDINGIENWGYGPAKEFIHFTLHKENKDTMDAVNIICKLLRVPTRNIRFAGTKDRRGVTCQRLSISRMHLDRLNALNRTLKGMVIGGYKFEDISLNLGELQGNEFIIVIRDVELKDKSVKLDALLSESCQSLSKDGFINYFGMQRFGTFSISTHVIGRELLLENWKQAAELILSDQDNVLPISKEARKLWQDSKDPVAALSKMPRQCIAENAILKELSGHKRDEDGEFSSTAYYLAISKIPRNLRTMYVHAYQSFVWNAVASKRIELHGLQVVEGDLVVSDKSTATQLEVGEEEFMEDLSTSEFVRAKPVTKEDIEAQKYTMSDIVLPTPGFDIIYPSDDALRQVYVNIMKEDGMDPFDMRRKVRDFSLAGSYRNVIAKPTDLEYRVVHYKEATQQLVNTDLEMLNNKRGKDNGQKYMKDKLERFVPDKGGEKTAVILKFKLGVSAYATMALRELMKVETSRRGDMCDVKV